MNRSEPRAIILSEIISGKLTTDKGESQAFTIYDVSEHGLGVWLSVKLSIGQKCTVVVNYGEPFEFAATVKWCQDLRDEGSRIGLVADSTEPSLLKLYEKCLKSESGK